MPQPLAPTFQVEINSEAPSVRTAISRQTLGPLMLDTANCTCVPQSLASRPASSRTPVRGSVLETCSPASWVPPVPEPPSESGSGSICVGPADRNACGLDAGWSGPSHLAPVKSAPIDSMAKMTTAAASEKSRRLFALRRSLPTVRIIFLRTRPDFSDSWVATSASASTSARMSATWRNDSSSTAQAGQSIRWSSKWAASRSSSTPKAYAATS